MKHTDSNRLSAKFQKATAMAVFCFLGFSVFTASADARLIFTTEGDGNLVDQDEDGDGNYSLFFGSALEAEIEFDTVNDRFNINKDIRVDGDATTTGAATVGTNLTVIGTSDQQGNVANSTGNFTIADDTDVTGALDVQGGDITLQNDETISNATDGTIDITAADTTTSGNVNVGTNLDVSGTSTLDGDVTLNNDSQIINLRAENSTTLAGTVCTATSLGRIYYNTDTEDLLYCKEAVSGGTFAWTSVASGEASDVTKTFYAEFANFSVWADGTNNRGTLNAEYDDTDDRSYYQWQTRQATQQDYDLVLQWQAPANFSEFKTGVTNHLQFDIETGGANGQVDLRDVQVNGADQGVSDLANTAGTWATQDVDLSGMTIAAGDTVTFRFTVYGQSGGSTASVSNVKVNYTQQ